MLLLLLETKWMLPLLLVQEKRFMTDKLLLFNCTNKIIFSICYSFSYLAHRLELQSYPVLASSAGDLFRDVLTGGDLDLALRCADCDLDFLCFGDLDLDFCFGDLDLDFLCLGDLDLDFFLTGDF